MASVRTYKAIILIWFKTTANSRMITFIFQLKKKNVYYRG